MVPNYLVEEAFSVYPEPQRGWRRFMAFTAYVDDSGSEPSSPTYVLGGVMLPEGWWTKLSEEWVAVLHAPPRVEYYKGSEVWDREKGPFANLSDDERRDKVDALIDVLTEYHPSAFSVRLKWKDFKDFVANVNLEEDKKDPYFFLFYAVHAFLALKQHMESKFTPVDCIFDQQNGIGQTARNWYAFFKAKTTDRVQAILGKKPEFGDEKRVIPLQAADMFAWYRRRDAAGALLNDWNQNAWARLSKYHDSVVLEPEHLLKMAKDLDIIKK